MSRGLKTFSVKPSQIARKWYQLSADDVTLGRLATKVAELLLGKGKPQFTRHIDCGDFVVVINADKLKVTGKKLDQKKYYRHSGYPGGLKTRTLGELMAINSSEVVIKAVRGMLPDNKLRAPRMLRLKVYAGADHLHAPQQPIVINLNKDA